MLNLFVLLAMDLHTAATGTEIARVRFHEIAGISRRNEVVSVGVLVPRGRARPGDVWEAECGGRRVRAQSSALLSWPDGSVRAVRLVFPVTIGARRSRTVKLLRSGPDDGAVVESLAWEEDGAVRMRGARVELLVPPEVECAFTGLQDRRDGAVVVRWASTGTGGGPRTPEILEDGPWRAVVRQVGSVASATGPELEVERLVTVTARADFVEVETRAMCAARRGAGVPVDLVLETAGPVRSVGGERPDETPWAYEVDGRGEAPRSRFDGRLAVVSGRRRFGLAVEGARRLVPWRLAVPGVHQLVLGIVGDSYHWWRGVRPGRVVRIGVGRRAPAPPRTIVVERPPAAAVVAAPNHPAGDRIQRLLEAELDRQPSFLDWRGEENDGDWRWSRVNAGNHEYDTIGGLRTAGLRLSRTDLLAAAGRALRHMIRRDLDLGGTGLPLRHGPRHRLGGIDLGHVWLEGPLEAALDRADRFVWDDLTAVAERWRGRVDEADLVSLPTHCLGWALLSAAALARVTRGKADLARLRGLRDALADAPGDDLLLLEHLKDEEDTARVSTWASAGIVGEAMWQAERLAHHAAACARFRAGCLRLAREGWDRREGRLFKTLLVDERDGTVVHRAGRASGEEMLFFALGLLRARALGGLADLESVALEVLHVAPDRLRLEHKTFRGMEISQLLWLHPRLFGWRDR